MPEIRLGIVETTDPNLSHHLMVNYIKAERIEV